ncbi:MAG: glutamate formimidoyltransferase [Chloroflexi bacterium]|nr:glutamate formimidoyltransferase [Chloroflexota bacterium]MCL5075253.1 glutamate formimidoyltransferase [Chloroflexota bacterium]
MRRLIECVPNISEGRRPEVVEQVVSAIRDVPGIYMLDVETDADHNRAVLTFCGEPEPVLEAAFQTVKMAAQLIDLHQHRGQHPRIGAADVVPLVPLSGVTMEECVPLARQLGRRIGAELQIPVYLYSEAATRPERRNLADIRRGEFESLEAEIATNPARQPDFGPSRVTGAGATAVGVRLPLIAFNVNLATDDVSIAKAIARTVRESSGGLPYVKAIGLPIADRNIVQVSLNMTNYRETPLFQAFEAIKVAAAKYGVTILESEIVGLVPGEALVQVAKHYLQLERFDPRQVLENRLQEALGDN